MSYSASLTQLYTLFLICIYAFFFLFIYSVLGKNICAYVTLIGNAILVVMLPLLVANLNSDQGFIAALVCMLVIGALNAVNLSTMFAYFAVFPFRFLQALMVGQGVSGVVVSAIRAITKAAYGDSEHATEDAAFLYFCVAGGFTFLCVFAFAILRTTNFTKFYIAENDNAKNLGEEVSDALVSAESGYSVTGSANGEDTMAADEPISMFTTLRSILPGILNVSGVFIITFLCFPGLMIAAKPTIDLDEEWFSVINILIFNVFDFIGRSLPSFVLLWNEKNVHYPIIFRFICYPLFILAAKSDISFFNDSYFVIVLNCFFAISNGYLSSIVMMTAGNYVSEKERETASSFMSASLTTSILVGSTLALCVDAIFF